MLITSDYRNTDRGYAAPRGIASGMCLQSPRVAESLC